jgi:hypothetical protein
MEQAKESYKGAKETYKRANAVSIVSRTIGLGLGFMVSAVSFVSRTIGLGLGTMNSSCS